MDSKHPFSEGPWHCKHCQKPFSVWEDLTEHKKRMRNENKEDHIHCRFCGRDFHTLEGEMRHMQVEHPLEQNLDCPGCGQGPFKRLGTLMSHIERGFCTRIDSAVLDELREEKLAFPRRLEQLTQESIKGNYMKYMPSPNDKSYITGWYVEDKPTPFKMVPEEFPDLSTTAVERTQPPTAVSSNEAKPNDGSDAGEKVKKATQHQLRLPFRPANKTEIPPTSNSDKKAKGSIRLPLRLLSDTNRGNNVEAPNSVQHTQPAFNSGVTTVIAGMDPDDPNTGITSHAETRGSKCRLQDTAHYETFMDQLTAGIVDIERTRYQDGSIIFKTSEQAKQKLRGEATEKKMKYPINKEPEAIFW
ncbi:hypothetical protein TrVFT333_000378 [Trichoderma virens FT-333]|nr:hypothetical protein TrVFT333_000378 [Trichoderma virens FT-333]